MSLSPGWAMYLMRGRVYGEYAPVVISGEPVRAVRMRIRMFPPACKNRDILLQWLAF